MSFSLVTAELASSAFTIVVRDSLLFIIFPFVVVVAIYKLAFRLSCRGIPPSFLYSLAFPGFYVRNGKLDRSSPRRFGNCCFFHSLLGTSGFPVQPQKTLRILAHVFFPIFLSNKVPLKTYYRHCLSSCLKAAPLLFFSDPGPPFYRSLL